jgi:hypothetical protein
MREVPKVFISYSHKDEKWKDWLRRHLDVEVKQNRLIVWDDRLTKTGDKYRVEINNSIEKSDIAILLISSHFLTSDFILNEEIPLILERKLTLYPIIISPCNWNSIEWLEPIQGVTKNNESLDGKSDSEINQQFVELATAITISPPPPPPPQTIDKIFTIFEQDDIDEQSYKVSIYIQDEDEFNSEQIDFEFKNIHDKKEQERFISLLVNEFESDVTIHFIIPPELFEMNFKQWRYKHSELVKRYHILLHNKERFDSKLRRYKQLIRRWKESYINVKEKHLIDALMCVDNGEAFDTRLDKIGVYFRNHIDKETIANAIDMAKVGLWQYRSGKLEIYRDWIGCNISFRTLESNSRKCDHIALLWDDMSLLKNLKELNI